MLNRRTFKIERSFPKRTMWCGNPSLSIPSATAKLRAMIELTSSHKRAQQRPS
jgi:hypothetical protein